MSRQRIVILGGGFGGVYAARRLERHFGHRPDIEIALVSRDNYLTFQPLLPEVVSGRIGLVDTIAPLRRLCARTHLYTRPITEIDLEHRVIRLSPGLQPRALTLPFDHLILALGNISAVGLPGIRDHALAFKSLGDALHLRNHVLHVLEEAAIEPDLEIRRGLTTFVIAGGGFSGVELVAELNDFVRDVISDYRDISPADLRVVLLHSRDRILQELDDDLAAFAQSRLIRKGVEVKLNVRLAGATGTHALLTSGERISTRTIVATVPSAPNPLIATLPLPKDHDRIVVDETLAVPGHTGIWAIGDCAAVKEPNGRDLAPTTAQHAIREAKRAADNIAAVLSGRPCRPFTFSSLGQLAALGRRSAVADVCGIKISGILAWWLWRTIYLAKLPGLDRKVRVAIDWTLDMFARHDIVQLNTERSAALAYEHFESGDVIVRQGDVGDKLFVIRAGEVEVVPETDGVPGAPIARLKTGDYFGEMALLTGRPRGATVRALGPVDVLVVTRQDFIALVGSFPELRRGFDNLAHSRAMNVDQAEGELKQGS